MSQRRIQVQEPVMYPSCCVNCGAVQNSGRWFVDLGFDIDNRFDALPEGVVYLCEICVRNFIRELMTVVEKQEMGLDYVRFRGNQSDPVFNEYRQQLDGIEQGTDSNGTDVGVSKSILTATFGGD